MKTINISAAELSNTLKENLASQGHVFNNANPQGETIDLSSLVSVHAGATYLWVIGKSLSYAMLERINDIINAEGPTPHYINLVVISRGALHPFKARNLKQDRLGIIYFDAHKWHPDKPSTGLFHQDSDHIADTQVTAPPMADPNLEPVFDIELPKVLEVPVASPLPHQYQTCLRKFKMWGGELPTNTDQVIQFFEDKGHPDKVERLTVQTLKGYMSALKDWHDRYSEETPFKDKRVMDCLKSLKRQERANGVFGNKSRDLTPHECLKLVALLCVMNDTAKAKRKRALATIAYMTGYRAGMVGDIKVEWLRNLKYSNQEIIIDRPPFKTDKHIKSTIPYTGAEFCPATFVREYIEVYDIKGGYLFEKLGRGGIPVHSDKPFHRSSVNSILQGLLTDAGIDGGTLTAHSFRKTLATISIMQNVPVADIAAQAGWSDVSTIQNHYVSDAISMLGRAPAALIEATKAAAKKIELFESNTNTLTSP